LTAHLDLLGANVSVLYLVLPVGIALSALFLWGCVRAIQSGQFDDLETPAHRVLLDEDSL
jgi:cbb3-type cytochrome oxidase maturation protein